MYKYRNIYGNVNEDKEGTSIGYIEIAHTTDYTVPYKKFHDGTFMDPGVYRIGEYVLSYEDGGEYEIPVIFGWNISNRDISWKMKESSVSDTYDMDPHLSEVASTTFPFRENGVTYFRFISKNPYPEQRVKGIHFKQTIENCNLYINSVKFV